MNHHLNDEPFGYLFGPTAGHQAMNAPSDRKPPHTAMTESSITIVPSNPSYPFLEQEDVHDATLDQDMFSIDGFDFDGDPQSRQDKITTESFDDIDDQSFTEGLATSSPIAIAGNPTIDIANAPSSFGTSPNSEISSRSFDFSPEGSLCTRFDWERDVDERFRVSSPVGDLFR